jgi:hypothetical protein
MSICRTFEYSCPCLMSKLKKKYYQSPIGVLKWKYSPNMGSNFSKVWMSTSEYKKEKLTNL